MAVDASKVHIASTGKVLTAPLATPAPVDVTAAWGSAWTELGYTSEDGVQLKADAKLEERRPWQSIWAVKRWVAERDLNLTFTTWEWKGSTLVLAFGGGLFTTAGTGGTLVNTYTVPNDTAIYEVALGVEWQDGDGHTSRLIVPKGMVTSNVDTKLSRKDLIMMLITFSATATGVGPTAYWLSNDPALVPAG